MTAKARDVDALSLRDIHAQAIQGVLTLTDSVKEVIKQIAQSGSKPVAKTKAIRVIAKHICDPAEKIEALHTAMEATKEDKTLMEGLRGDLFREIDALTDPFAQYQAIRRAWNSIPLSPENFIPAIKRLPADRQIQACLDIANRVGVHPLQVGLI